MVSDETREMMQYNTHINKTHTDSNTHAKAKNEQERLYLGKAEPAKRHQLNSL